MTELTIAELEAEIDYLQRKRDSDEWPRMPEYEQGKVVLGLVRKREELRELREKQPRAPKWG